METQDKKYDALLNKLRSVSPIINDPTMLTDSIMKSIQPGRHTDQRETSVFWLRTLSTAAAVFFLGLFLFQTNENYNVYETGSSSRLLKITLQKKDYCEKATQANMQNKNVLMAQYVCYLERNTSENKASKLFLMKLIPKK